MHTFEVRIEAEMMRQAWNAWFFKGRRMGRLALAGFLILTGILMDVRQGHFGTISVVAATILGFSILIYGTAYFVGLRRAQAKLKDKFDIRVFHDTVLANGGLPLEVLERLTDEWIAREAQK